MTETSFRDDRIARAVAEAAKGAPFDGWTGEGFDKAVAAAGIAPGEARVLFPHGGRDLAAAYHRDADARLTEAMAEADLTGMRYSQKVAHAIWLRLQLVASDREAVRKATALFSLPQNAAEGAKLIWGTADTIWNALGDTSDDANWYSKRAILSGVYGSTVLYWLGDQSADQTETRAYIDRRIDDVMAFERFKARFRDTPFGKAFARGPGQLMSRIRKPADRRGDLPGAL